MAVDLDDTLRPSEFCFFRKIPSDICGPSLSPHLSKVCWHTCTELVAIFQASFVFESLYTLERLSLQSELSPKRSRVKVRCMLVGGDAQGSPGRNPNSPVYVLALHACPGLCAKGMTRRCCWVSVFRGVDNKFRSRKQKLVQLFFHSE